MEKFFSKITAHPLASLRLCVGFWCCLVSAVLAGPRVALEAAHGGDDPGVKVGGATEKDWDLKFVQALSKALDESGFTPVLIRRKDEALSQDKRDELINTAQVSAVLVIHAEREWSGTQRGPLLVVQPPNRPESGGGDLPRWGFVSPTEYRASLHLARSLAGALGLGPELSALSDSRGSAGEKLSEEGRLLCLPHSSLRNLTPPAVVLIPLFLTSEQDRKAISEGTQMADVVRRVVAGLRAYFQMESPVQATPDEAATLSAPASPPAAASTETQP